MDYTFPSHQQFFGRTTVSLKSDAIIISFSLKNVILKIRSIYTGMFTSKKKIITFTGRIRFSYTVYTNIPDGVACVRI